jgi:hypothetical protein
MSTVPRNAPCPCGSGRKHKLCCGTTQSQERASRQALEDLLGLASCFPLLRPDSDDFENWLTVHRGEPSTRELIEDGGGLLSVRERERIALSVARWYPPAWADLVAAVGSEDDAKTAVLVGSLVAALAEELLPDEFVLGLLEDDPAPADPAEALVLCIEATDLWSVPEALAADEAVAAIPDLVDEDEYEREWVAVLEREAANLLTKRHRRRLWLLVGRLRAGLPIAGFPRASHALELACASFERDRRLQSRVAAALLADTLGPLYWQQSRLAA